jgi:hypothetical protein
MPSPHQLPLPSASVIEVHERVRIAVDFRGPKVRPLAFLWRNRKIVVKKTNMVFKRQHGNKWYWCFAVSDETNNYVLRYEPEEMVWTLEEVYEG